MFRADKWPSDWDDKRDRNDYYLLNCSEFKRMLTMWIFAMPDVMMWCVHHGVNQEFKDFTPWGGLKLLVAVKAPVILLFVEFKMV